MVGLHSKAHEGLGRDLCKEDLGRIDELVRAYVSGVAGGLGQGGPQVDGCNAGQGAKADDDTPHVVQVVDVCTGVCATLAHVMSAILAHPLL